MPYYETVFMARPDMTESQVKELTENMSNVITNNGGKIHKIENWGLRKLAYKINKSARAHYVMIESDAPSAAVIEMERLLGLNEDVMRNMTVKNDALSKGPSIILQKNEDREDRYNKDDKFNKEEAA